MLTDTHTSPDNTDTHLNRIRLRKAESRDGSLVHDLVRRCKPLDENSTYCNLLQCTHFADTCVAAEQNGELVGFISGYIPPRHPNTLFIWQVAVDERMRGQGLARRMLNELLERPHCAAVQYLETTIIPENESSWNMFRRFARDRRARTESFIFFDSDTHFSGQHESEHLLRIGPLHKVDVAERLN